MYVVYVYACMYECLECMYHACIHVYKNVYIYACIYRLISGNELNRGVGNEPATQDQSALAILVLCKKKDKMDTHAPV